MREGGSNDEVVEGLEGFPRAKKSRRGPFVAARAQPSTVSIPGDFTLVCGKILC